MNKNVMARTRLKQHTCFSEPDFSLEEEAGKRSAVLTSNYKASGVELVNRFKREFALSERFSSSWESMPGSDVHSSVAPVILRQ